MTFACYLSSSKSFLICLAWEQYKLAQVLNSNLISEWLKTLTKQLYCSKIRKSNCVFIVR